MSFNKIDYVFTGIFLIHILCLNTSAQISAYESVINPYKDSGLQMPTFASFFSGVPAKEGFMSSNPSAMLDLEETNIALSWNYLHTISYMPSKYGSGSREEQSENHLHPGSLSIVHPSATSDPKMLFYLIFNPQISSMTELGYQPRNHSGLYEDQSEGKAGSITPGVVVAMEQWSVGLSWTKWFGSTKWKSSSSVWAPALSSSEKSINYNGSNFQISNYVDLNYIRLGLIYYTPLALMTVANNKISQEFEGAYEIGISSEIVTGITFAVSYFYQNSFKMKHWDEENNNDEKYKSGQELSFGIEYESKKSKFLFPAFFVLKLDWLPQEDDSGDFYYNGPGSEPDNPPDYELILGTSLAVSNLTILLFGHYRAHYTKAWEIVCK